MWDDYTGEWIGGDYAGGDDYTGEDVAIPSNLDQISRTFYTPGGGIVDYLTSGVTRTQDPSGRTSFYGTGDAGDVFVDYTNPDVLGELVSTFFRAPGGEGPTQAGFYRGTGDDATAATYTDLYNTTGGKGTVRVGGPGGITETTNVGGTGGTTKIIDTKTGDVTKELDNPPPDGGGKSLTDILKDPRLLALLGGIAGVATRKQGGMPKIGYQGGIPKYTATRGPARSPTEGGRRPGGEGIGSLTGGVRFERQPDAVGIPASGNPLDQVEPAISLASGGRAARYLAGGTDGMADKINTDIDGKQPARLSHGEFVIPADVVSHLGNGNSDAGAKVLYDMMAKVRKARTGTPKQGKQIDPRKFTKV
jgi:hypothetical protein